MRIIVATVVHDPDDARIRHRQIPALLAAGHQVVYVAPEGGVGDDATEVSGLERRIVPRAFGRRRLSALRAVARVLAVETPRADLTIVHDPELTVLDRWIRGPRIFDVHEDLPAQVVDKDWIPVWLRPAISRLGARLERRAAGRFSLLLAEDSYQERLGDHPVVPNVPVVPPDCLPSGGGRVVHLGRLSYGRGAETIVAAARELPWMTVESIGPVDEMVRSLVTSGSANLDLIGPLPSPVALSRIAGATAGLALLQDRPNYRGSVPTKVLEYMAHGVPVVATPLPALTELVGATGAGILVPFDDYEAVVEAVSRLDGDPDLRRRCAVAGREVVAAYDWTVHGPRFVEACRAVAQAG